MTPVSPVLPGSGLSEVVFAENQPEYIPLPAHVTPDGLLVTRWKLTWAERLRVFVFGHFYLSVLTFNQDLQPLMLSAKFPIELVMEHHGMETRT